MLFLYRKNPCKIQEYTLFGERHSGTKFLADLIKKAFGIQHTNKYGHKHFFGFVDPSIILQDKTTLFLGIVRNPYDWIAAMNNLPHHVPKHLSPLYDHLLDEWYSIDEYRRVFDPKLYTIDKLNKEIIEDRSFSTKNRYKNIFDMRTNKINYLTNKLSIYAHNYVLISYEALLSNITLYIDSLSASFGLKINQSTLNKIKVNPAPHREIPISVRNLITNHLNWRIENQIGYTQENVLTSR